MSVDNSASKQEKWYVFDMYPEHIDPRLQYWLEHEHGIITKVHAGGRRGLWARFSGETDLCKMHASTHADRPNDFLKYSKKLTEDQATKLTPISVTVGITSLLPSLDILISEHDKLYGKPKRPIRNPLDENFGRSPKRENIIEYLEEILTTISELMSRVKRCSTDGLNSEFSVEIEDAENGIELLSLTVEAAREADEIDRIPNK